MGKDRKLLVFNWKAYLGIDESVALARYVAESYHRIGNSIAIAPMHLALSEVSREVDGRLGLSAQDIDLDSGAHTGSVPVDMVRGLGCSYSLVGHSETRYRDSSEGNDLIAKKVAACINNGMVPILCFGELLDERLCGETEEVIRDQVGSGVSGIKDMKKLPDIILAYEPVWAISSSKNAREPEAKEIEEGLEIARTVIEHHGLEDHVRFLYGGSVNPSNARGHIGRDGISGLLVGKAGTEKNSLDAIIAAAGLIG